MRAPRLGFVFALGVSLGLAIAAGEAMADPGDRPPSELSLFLRLNGVPRRFQLADAGMSGLYGSAVTCMPVTARDVLKVQCSAAAHICAASQDAGCVTTPVSDYSYGEKLAADTSMYIVASPGESTLLCMVPVSGTVNCAVWQMR